MTHSVFAESCFRPVSVVTDFDLGHARGRRWLRHKSRLTDSVVMALKPAPKEYEVHDTLRDGLCLRVNPGGTKSWTLFYHRDGRNRPLGLGRYP